MKLLDRNEKVRVGVYEALSSELTEVVEHSRFAALTEFPMEKLAQPLPFLPV